VPSTRRTRLLFGRNLHRAVEGPGDGLGVRAGLARDSCGRRAQGVRVDLLPRAQADDGDSGRAELAVHVHDRDAAGFAPQLAVGREPSEQAVELRIELCGGAGQLVVIG
jgi:hypothetical protein